jgi:outer membrane receptor protein involved in Fe transport
MTSALVCAGFASAAFAQAAPAAKPAATTTNSQAIEEVVVTATRQTSTVNKVALSVSAVTQKNLDQQGIRSVQDLSQQVPGFTYRVSGGDNNPNLTLRGIGANALAGTSGSAPTTGVYIDDQPLMKRNANGLVTGSGSPLPLLYDLDRIEVLRGPQGTLYGGSSEGGTLRFIMPTPSLTTYSGSARVGWSTMSTGGMGGEVGLALGGPIIQDKLGFRAAGFTQWRPGWVDNFSEWDGHQIASNVNWGNDYSLRGALLWQIMPQFKATLSVLHQMNYDNDAPTVRTSSPAQPVPVVTFNNTGTVNGVRFSFPATTFGGFTIPAQVWLGNGNGTNNGLYLSSTNVQYINSPRRTIFTTPSLALDYNWNDKLDFKSITAYMDDTTGGWQFTGNLGIRNTVLPNYVNQPCPSGPGSTTPILLNPSASNPNPTLANGCTVAPQFIELNSTPGVAIGLPTGQVGGPGPYNAFGYFLYNNRRGQTTQEFRVTTTDPSWRLQFVIGGFIEHENNHVNVGASWNENLVALQTRGYNEAFFSGGEMGVPVQQKPGAGMWDVSTRNIDITEDEQSIFADFTFAVTSKFKIEAGVRAVNYTQQYYQQYGGNVAGAPSGFLGVAPDGSKPSVNTTTGVITPATGIITDPNYTGAFPTNYGACPVHLKDAATTAAQLQFAAAGCPYQYTAINLKENPVTPKFGASYQLTPGDLIYVTYAEGYRPGGINPPAPPIMCAADFANLGITQSPGVYERDYVKSTELGGKFRLFNGQAQINAAAFHIDWENVQLVESLPLCAFSYIANAAKAASDGAEAQITARTHGFTINTNIAYNNARYTEQALGPPRADGKPRSILVNKGDNLGAPDWTANIGVQYDTRVMDFPTYMRLDYIYTGKYMRATSCQQAGLTPVNCTASFNATATPNFINGNETHIMNARVGFYYKDLEIAGYVKNLFDSREWINKAEGNGTFWFTGNTVQPRIIGLQANYRF